MKTALILALLGACVAVSYASCYGDYEHKCVKDEYKKCTAVKVCENAKKEKCGYEYCDYGYVCASKKKAVCKDFVALKAKCEKKKVCKEVKKSCGHTYCGYDEECVKDKVCKVKYSGGRRLFGDTKAVATSEAYAGSHGPRPYDGPGKRYGPSYYQPCDYCEKKERLECYDAYSCVKKEPCKEVVAKKCVKDALRPGHDVCHGGRNFKFVDGYSYGQECGGEYCGEGYKCADVYYQECSSTPCGDHYCDYGYECVAEDDYCKEYAYLETICKDVYEPTCVALGYYAREAYYPKCKTVYKCDEYENVCGGKYCGYGYTCAVSKCGGYYGEDKYYYDQKYYDKYYSHGYPKGGHGYPSKPHYPGYPSKPHYPGYPSKPHYPGYPSKPHYPSGGPSYSSSSTTAHASGGHSSVHTNTHQSGPGHAGAYGGASTPHSSANGASNSDCGYYGCNTNTHGEAHADGYYGSGYVDSGATAEKDDYKYEPTYHP